MKQTILTLGCIVLLFFGVKADSPITSTSFHTVYADLEMVSIATQSKGELTTQIAEYLGKKREPIAEKLAVINALSWDINGKSNAIKYWEINLSKKYKNETNFIRKGNAEELIMYAYLLALDDYFNVENALSFANAAIKKNNKNYSIAIIQGLIHAQQLINTDWCQTYMACNTVRTNKNLKQDLSLEASAIIFEYMDLYKDYCK